METGTFLEVANEAINHSTVEQVIDEQLSLLINGNILNFSTYLCPFKWLELCYLPTKSYKFGINI